MCTGKREVWSNSRASLPVSSLPFPIPWEVQFFTAKENNEVSLEYINYN